MLFGIITLITALSMAGVAAWFAVAGIMAVFAGAPIAALIMGTVIEAGKIVGVSWLYQNSKAKTKIKYILAPLVIVSMLLTSMGIFGFLSKAHLEQITPVGNNSAQIERLDQRIVREQNRIDDSEIVISQLDETVQVLINFNRISHPETGARVVRAGQQAQRDELAAVIDEAGNKISTYEDEKYTLGAELRALEIEVGPVKYIAAMIYEDPESSLDDAVRWVIIAFIFVFDPLAITLLVSANYTLMSRRKTVVVNESEVGDSPGSDLIDLMEESQKTDTKVTAEELQAVLSVDPEVIDKALEKLNARREPTAEELRARSTLRALADRRKVDDEVRAGVPLNKTID